jgi:hypothetical protein
LHHTRLQNFPSSVRHDFARRRPDKNVAELKVILIGETCRTGGLQQGWPLVHDEIIRLLGKSSAIHQAPILSNPVACACNRATNWRVLERKAGAKRTA